MNRFDDPDEDQETDILLPGVDLHGNDEETFVGTQLKVGSLLILAVDDDEENKEEESDVRDEAEAEFLDLLHDAQWEGWEVPGDQLSTETVALESLVT